MLSLRRKTVAFEEVDDAIVTRLKVFRRRRLLLIRRNRRIWVCYPPETWVILMFLLQTNKSIMRQKLS